MAIKQEVNSQLIVTVGVISGLMLVVIIIGLQAWFVYEEQAEVQSKWAQSHNVQLERILSAQRERIEQRGPTTIPVEQAVQALIERGGRVSFADPATRPATRPAATRPAGKPADRQGQARPDTARSPANVPK